MLKSKEGKNLISNFLSLSVLKGFDFLLPLISLPYMVRVLGVSKYGHVAFAQSLMFYFIAVTDYGFNLSATREIATNRNDLKKVEKIFSSVLFAKLFLLAVSFTILLLLIYFVPKISLHPELFLFAFLLPTGQVLFPVWFFQGMEKMRFITIFNIFAKLIFTALIFIVIQKPSDYIYVLLLNGIGFVFAGVSSLIFIFMKFNISLNFPTIFDVFLKLKEGFYIFITNLVPALYTTSSTFILGLTTSSVLVGYYSAGAKIIELFNAFIYILSRTFYPYLNRNFEKFKIIKKIFIAVGLGGSLFSFIFAKLIVHIVFGSKFPESALIIRILSPSIFAIAIMSCFGDNYLLVKKMDKTYMKMITVISVTGFLFALFVIPRYHHFGASFVVLFTRSFIALGAFLIAHKHMKKST